MRKQADLAPIVKDCLRLAVSASEAKTHEVRMRSRNQLRANLKCMTQQSIRQFYKNLPAHITLSWME
jgi:hypothetical protein